MKLGPINIAKLPRSLPLLGDSSFCKYDKPKLFWGAYIGNVIKSSTRIMTIEGDKSNMVFYGKDFGISLSSSAIITRLLVKDGEELSDYQEVFEWRAILKH